MMNCGFVFIMCIGCRLCGSLSVSFLVFFFKRKTAYEMRISDWSSDVCSSDLDFRQFVHYLTHRVDAAARRFGRGQGKVEVLACKLCHEHFGFERVLSRGERIGHFGPDRLDGGGDLLAFVRSPMFQRLEQTG